MTNKEKYKRSFDRLAMDQPSFTELNHKKKIRVPKAVVAGAVALVCMALCIPVATRAEEVKEYILKVLGQETKLDAYISDAVYEDSDGHVKMTVTELLISPQLSRAILTYEAEDDIGAAWIQNFSYDDEICGNWWEKYGIHPMKDRSYGYYFEELEAYRTDRRLCLSLLMDCEEYWGEPQIQIKYVMTDCPREAVLTAPAVVQSSVYTLEGKQDLIPGLEIHKLVLTDFGCTIYGKNTGIRKQWVDANGYHETLDVDENVSLPTAELILDDGTVIRSDLFSNGGGLGEKRENEPHPFDESELDIIVLHFSYSSGYAVVPDTIPASRVVGIRINGEEFCMIPEQ